MLTISPHFWTSLVLSLVGALNQDEVASPKVTPSGPVGIPVSRFHEVRIVLKEGQTKVTDKPLTVALPLGKIIQTQIMEAIAKYPGATVRLSMRNVRPPSDRKAIHGFNIFLNKPDATSATPEDDPHFVRAIEFSPTNSQEPEGFNVNILSTLVQLKEKDRENFKRAVEEAGLLKITIVAMPARGVSRIPEEAWFSVHEVVLSVPQRAEKFVKQARR